MEKYTKEKLIVKNYNLKNSKDLKELFSFLSSKNGKSPLVNSYGNHFDRRFTCENGFSDPVLKIKGGELYYLDSYWNKVFENNMPTVANHCNLIPISYLRQRFSLKVDNTGVIKHFGGKDHLAPSNLMYTIGIGVDDVADYGFNYAINKLVDCMIRGTHYKLRSNSKKNPYLRSLLKAPSPTPVPVVVDTNQLDFKFVYDDVQPVEESTVNKRLIRMIYKSTEFSDSEKLKVLENFILS